MGGINGVNGKSPLSPTIPHKPSNLSLSKKPSRSAMGMPSPLNTSVALSANGSVASGTNGTVDGEAKEKVDVLAGLHVKNAAEPRELVELAQKGANILFLDVRTREEFMRERVKGSPVVCIEPSVLGREMYVLSPFFLILSFSGLQLIVITVLMTLFRSVNSQTIESSLSIAPRDELMFFNNRDKFDLVVVYDHDSTSLGSLNSNSPLSVLVKAIYEMEFKKILKQVPVLMLGGYEAWKRDVGTGEAIPESTSASASSSAMPPPLNMQTHSSPQPPLALASQPISPTTSTPPLLPSIHEGFQSPPPSASVQTQSNRASPLSNAGRSRAGTESLSYGSGSAHGHMRDGASSGYQDRRSLDQIPGSSAGLMRKPALSRPPSIGNVTSFSRSISDNVRLLVSLKFHA